MAETHVVSALVDKRAELAGQISRFEQQIGQFRADLTSNSIWKQAATCRPLREVV